MLLFHSCVCLLSAVLWGWNTGGADQLTGAMVMSDSDSDSDSDSSLSSSSSSSEGDVAPKKQKQVSVCFSLDMLVTSDGMVVLHLSQGHSR